MRSRSLQLLISLAATCSLTGVACAAEGEAFIDPAKAGPDFVVQGEYLGQMKKDGQDVKVGAHVIALGDGKFHAVAYMGGLPGEGWKRGDERMQGDGKTENGATTFKADGREGSAKIEGGKLLLLNSGGQTVGTLDKVERKSSTLGAKPPQGAIVLFDGSNTNHWQDGKITDDHLLAAGPLGKDEFTDFTLHIEFRTPFMPKARDQGRGNSGVYLQNRYEVQVLDSFGLEGANNECAGLYSIREPLVNMCYPPLSWQTYDVDFTGARFEGDKKVKNARLTMKHNGVLVYDNFELPDKTPGGAPTEAPGRGPFQLQNHGNPVTFRNIWVVEKK